jgi:type I restriction enzyme S subunit
MKTWQGSLAVSGHEGIVSPAYYVGRRITDVDNRFMHHLLRSLPLIAEYGARSKGIRPSQWDLPWDEFASIKVAIPAFAEQKAIADYLDRETMRIDALIEKKQGMINLLDHRWSNKLREIVEVQPQAEIMQLRRCVEKIVSGNWGGEPGTSAVEALCVRAGDFDFRTYSANSGVMRSFSTGDVEKSRLREGDLILEKSGGGEESPVGRVVEWKSYEVAIPTNFAAGVRANKRVSRKYLLYLFAACYSSRLTTRSIKQTTGIQNLDMGSYLSEKVPVPSLTVQEAIVERLDKVLFNIRTLQNCLEVQIEVLRERRRALITAAVTGELEIPEVAA